jgi:hypothetical protein
MPKYLTDSKGHPERTPSVRLALTSRKTSPDIEEAAMTPGSRGGEKYPDVRKASRDGSKRYYSPRWRHHSLQGKYTYYVGM